MAVLPKLRNVRPILALTQDGQKLFVFQDPLGLVPPTFAVPAEEFAALAVLLDGKTELEEVQAAIAERTGRIVPATYFERLIETLDTGMLVEGKNYAKAKAEYAQETVRPPVHAGQSYPAEADEARRLINGFYAHPEGPGRLPEKLGGSRRLVGLIAPHRDLALAGHCFAHAYRALATAKKPDTVVFLGQGHEPLQNGFALTKKTFRTPLGNLQADADFIARLTARAGCDLFADEILFAADFTVEFQAVMLAHLYGKSAPKIVPLLCGPSPDQPEEAEEEPSLLLLPVHYRQEKRATSPTAAPETTAFLEALRKTIEEAGPEVLVVASADLSHVGRRFEDHEPVTAQTLEKLRQSDLATLKVAETLQAERFYQHVHEVGNPTRICSTAVIHHLLRLVSRRASGAQLLHYSATVEKFSEEQQKELGYVPQTDEMGHSVVTYCAMAFYADQAPAGEKAAAGSILLP